MSVPWAVTDNVRGRGYRLHALKQRTVVKMNNSPAGSVQTTLAMKAVRVPRTLAEGGTGSTHSRSGRLWHYMSNSRGRSVLRGRGVPRGRCRRPTRKGVTLLRPSFLFGFLVFFSCTPSPLLFGDCVQQCANATRITLCLGHYFRSWFSTLLPLPPA